MRKFFSILMCFSFFAANIAAAWPVCASEKTELSCLQSHAAATPSSWELEQSQVSTLSIQAESCPCQNQDLCMGCCRSHTFLSGRSVVAQLEQPQPPALLIFPRTAVISVQTESRIERPPIT